MINEALIHPNSIVIIGGSEDITKPGGKIIQNLKDGKFKGQMFVVNPGAAGKSIQSLITFEKVDQLPQVDLAILAIPPLACRDAVKTLVKLKKTRAIIIISAGFGETGENGKQIESEIKDLADEAGCTLIGPNGIGVITASYSGVFTSPLPEFNPKGCDLISASGAMAVFLMEEGISKGLSFSNVFSVGNCAQIAVEDILEYLDHTYKHGRDAPVKILYFESIRHPDKLLQHSTSLSNKGCKIVALKSGRSEEGKKAAFSHTGAMSGSDLAVNALMQKAGIIRCFSRQELVAVVSVLLNKPLVGRNLSIITHAGGPAVILADILSEKKFSLPHEPPESLSNLMSMLHPGSSVKNPFDILATGNADQLDLIINHCVQSHLYDGIIIILGNPGLRAETLMFKVVIDYQKRSIKPIYLVIPSVGNVLAELKFVTGNGLVYFNDESVLAEALSRSYPTALVDDKPIIIPKINIREIQNLKKNISTGLLDFQECQHLLESAGISTVAQQFITSSENLIEAASLLKYPLVLKSTVSIHKSESGSIVLNIDNIKKLKLAFEKLEGIHPSGRMVLQKMIFGQEIFIGIKREEHIGHLLFFGLGGIFVEIIRDVNCALLPLNGKECKKLIRSIKSYEVLKGIRGNISVNEDTLIEILLRISALVSDLPEIEEMDINPLIIRGDEYHAVDYRIKISH